MHVSGMSKFNFHFDDYPGGIMGVCYQVGE